MTAGENRLRNFEMIRQTILLIVLVITACAFAAEKPRKKPLLRDGFVLMGLDGKLVARGDKWYFEPERDISDGRSAVAAGTRVELLASAGLEKMVAGLKENPGGNYRLYNALVTQYEGNNYLFCDYSVPLAEAGAAVSEKPGEPNKAAAQIRINEPNDAVMIPQEIIDKLSTRRIIRPDNIREGMELKQDSILADRTGFIKEGAKDRWVFEFDAIGRNASSVSLELLPCQVLADAQNRAGRGVARARFKVSGIVTKYRGRYYLLLQSANRAYGYGNFGG
jgi:hypothetical protein